MTDQPQDQPAAARRLLQAILGFLARGWNGPAAAETPDADVRDWDPRPDILLRATRAAFGEAR